MDMEGSLGRRFAAGRMSANLANPDNAPGDALW